MLDAASGIVHVFEITYPPDQNTLHDAQVIRMTRSMTSG